MLQPKDPIKRSKTSKERYSGDYRRGRDGNLIKLSDPSSPLSFGKYEEFFREAGNSRSGSRSIEQLGGHYNDQAFKEVILPQLQELNPDTNFYYNDNHYKCGGKMHAEGGDLTTFNAGGTHEQHPDGGIPQGVGTNGVVNRVEEGETKSDDYIYSDRLKVSHSHSSKFNLPKYMAGKSYAEATKLLDKRFEDREDRASLSTKQAFLERLQDSQERKKLESEARALGVNANELAEAKELQATSNTMSVGGALGSAGMGLFSDLAEDKSTSIGGSAANYAMQGAAAGSVVPGIGTAIGAGVGAISGAVMGKMNLDAAQVAQQEEDMATQGQKYLKEGYRKAEGGKLYAEGDELSLATDNIGVVDPLGDQFLTSSIFSPIEAPPSKGIQSLETEGMAPLEIIDTQKPTKENPPTKSKAAGIAGLVASTAPIIGNLVESSNLKPQENRRYARAGRTYLPQYADEQRMVNTVDQAFSSDRDRIAGASGGNVGTFRAGILGSSINKALARSNAFNRVNEINRQENAKVAEDYSQAAKEDANLYNREIIDQMQDRAAYDAARVAYRNSAYEGLGEIGKTLFGVSQYSDMTTYNALGNKKKTT